MKKWILGSLIVPLVAIAAWASITLDSSEVQSFSLGGVEIESNTVAAVTGLQMNFQSASIRVVLGYGKLVAGRFVAGPNAKPLVINITTEETRDGDGVVTNSGALVLQDAAGTNIPLTPSQRTAVLNIMSGLRNQVESFLLTKGVTDGTQVAW